MQSPFYNGGVIGATLDYGSVDYYQVPIANAGEQAYTTPGTYSWTAPAGVTSVCVAAVGGGGGGTQSDSDGAGGGGGGLGWKNNISVTPGDSYTVVVGSGGARGSTSASAGGVSYFIDAATVAGLGGAGASTTDAGGAGGTFVGDGGGNGGNGGNATLGADAGGGGGAGGYTGNGGNGGNANSSGSAGAGGGGGGGGAGGSADAAGGGGGVGILGQGANGAPGVYTVANGTGGGGGSGGANGVNGDAPQGDGGLYGGGGGGADNTFNEHGNGAGGAVRIIWGDGRAFPATATGEDPIANGNKKNSGIWLLQSVFDTLYTTPKTYRYFRFLTIAIRGGGVDSYVQMSELVFSLGATDVDMGVATVTNIAGSSPSGELPANLVDSSTATKWLNLSGVSGQGVQLDFGSPVTLDRYRWATANDQPHRDPVTWTLQGSDDASVWVNIDERVAQTITTDRQTYTAAYILS